MTGSMTFQEALKLRLDIIKPSLSQVKEFIKTQPPTLTPGVKYVPSHFSLTIYNLSFVGDWWKIYTVAGFPFT